MYPIRDPLNCCCKLFTQTNYSLIGNCTMGCMFHTNLCILNHCNECGQNSNVCTLHFICVCRCCRIYQAIHRTPHWPPGCLVCLSILPTSSRKTDWSVTTIVTTIGLVLALHDMIELHILLSPFAYISYFMHTCYLQKCYPSSNQDTIQLQGTLLSFHIQ